MVCVDNDVEKVRTLKAGKIPFYEPGLHEMVNDNVAAGRLSFSNKIIEVVNRCEVLFICVPTPSKPDGGADLSYVENVAKQVAKHLRKYCLIIEKSTVPVETGEWVRAIIHRNVRRKVPFDVASNPEFLREGSALHDFMKPDRIVIGVSSVRAEKILRKLYASMKAPLIVTDIASAELIKHASNSFLAMKISFANGLSRVCDAVGADVEKVTLGMGLDTRIGNQFLRAGVGFGGSCFPKDLKAFAHISKQLGVRFDLLSEVLCINELRRFILCKKFKNGLDPSKGKRLACWDFRLKQTRMICGMRLPLL